MIFSIDSFVHPCRQICTCNQSPVDTGLITVLIWHPAAFLVLTRTEYSSGGISEIKNEPWSPRLARGYLQSAADRAANKGFSRSGRQKRKEDIKSGATVPRRRCHRGWYRCRPGPPARLQQRLSACKHQAAKAEPPVC